MELSAFISNCELIKLNVKKGYTYSDFRDDLKSIFKQAGIKKKHLVFFIADKDIYEEIFLEDLDSLLTSGNIPDLFDVDELETMLMEIKTEAQINGISEDPQELYKYLINVSFFFLAFFRANFKLTNWDFFSNCSVYKPIYMWFCP